MLFLKISDPSPIQIIIINIKGLVFAYGMLTRTKSKIILNHGFIPNYFFYGNHSFSDSIVRLFSSMFLHAGIAHIAFNLFALAYLGGFAEKSIGKTRYLGTYLAAGIAGALLHGTVYTLILGHSANV